jgi:hypothetical protein
MSATPQGELFEGDSSLVHLDDNIRWKPSRVIPQVFLLVFGHTDTLTLLWTVFKDVSIPEAGRRQEQRRAAGGIGRLLTLYYC